MKRIRWKALLAFVLLVLLQMAIARLVGCL